MHGVLGTQPRSGRFQLPMQSPLAGVLAETDQLFTELDVTKQLRDNSLEGAADGETPAVEMDEAA